MIVHKVDFETILPVWRDKLWPNRKSAIEPFSAMTLAQGYDMSYETQPQIFLAVYEGEKIIAVNSIHKCSDDLARSRGLWVDPDFRGQGIGVDMLEVSIEAAKEFGVKMLWSFPRQSSWRTYEKAGFIPVSGWLDDGEFGPNRYAVAMV